MTEPTVWDYLETIAEQHPESRDRIDPILESRNEEQANQVLHWVWSMFENE